MASEKQKTCSKRSRFFCFLQGEGCAGFFLLKNGMWTNGYKFGRFKLGFLLVDSHREGAWAETCNGAFNGQGSQ
jgi:hypothetical protein